MDRFKDVRAYDIRELERGDLRDVDEEKLYIKSNEKDPEKLWAKINALEIQLANVKFSRMLYWEENMRNSLARCYECDQFCSDDNEVRDTDLGVLCFYCYESQCEYRNRGESDSESEGDSGVESDDENDRERKCKRVKKNTVRDDFETFNDINNFDIAKVQTVKYVV